ncbi:MAG: hypothetical protein M9930_13750 [Anaerolineae bacterium]|nr:hypothetical protein [Anaerolineae bacterium]
MDADCGRVPRVGDDATRLVVAELGVTVCTLDGLNEAEAALLQRLVPTVGAADRPKLPAELGYLPLALHLAGGLRRYRQIAPRNYLAQLRDVGLLRHPSLQGHGSTHSPTGHELSVARTFAVHAQQLDSGRCHQSNGMATTGMHGVFRAR